MIRKALFILGVILLIVAILLGYRYLKMQKLPDFSVYKAIPPDVQIIIESKDFIEKIEIIKSENKIWQEIQNLPELKSFDHDLEFILDIHTRDQFIKELTLGNDIVAAAYQLGKADLKFLFLMELRNQREKKTLLETIGSYTNTNRNIKPREYNGTEIYLFKDGDREFSFAFSKGIFLVSSSAILVENSIRQIEEKKSILNDPGFLRVQKTAGKNVDANIYLNLENMNRLISNTLNSELKESINRMQSLANWAELDVNLKDDAVLLNGFTFSNDSLNNYLNVFLEQSPVEHEMNRILPSNTAIFTFFGISNTAQYLKSYRNYLNKAGAVNQYQLSIDQYKNKYGIDLESFLLQQLDQEIGIVVTDFPSDGFDENTFMVMRTKSKSIAEQEIEQIITKIAKTNNKNKASYISDVRIDKETRYKVYELPIKNIFRMFFGKLFPEFNKQYLTFIDNFLVVGNSKNSLSKFIHSNILHKTLENDMRFERFTDYLSSKSNFYFYTNLYNSPKYLSGFLNHRLKKGLQTNVNTFQKFQALAVQFQNNNEMIYNNIYLQYIPNVKDDAVTVWESHLDTSINFKPVLVTNHYSKENEIFVQDLNNSIYLINKVGRILWKLNINEKINSDVYQVDYYKNGKLQLMFSTESKIHLIDRNGNYVERYPVKLRSPATAGMALFDYDKNLDYRIVIPCKNKNVYVYGVDGNLVNGWNFGQTDTHVSKTAQHFRVKTNDYIVFADLHRVYILNRRGEERIQLKNQFAKSLQNPFVLETGNNTESRFVTTDTSGLVKFIYLNGVVETKQVGNYSGNHYFDYQDMNADGYNDFIFLDENELKVYKFDGNKIFDYKFKEKILTAPVYYYFSYDDRKIGVVSEISNEIYLFNSDGSLYEGFPLKGNTPFTIGYLENNTNQFNLIVGTKYNFLYNYSVN